MRINQESRSMDMEPRDWNYLMPQYVRSYLFYCKNEIPQKVIFPMFTSVAFGGQQIPVEWVPDTSQIAVEITLDGANVPEATELEVKAKDDKEDEINQLRIALADITQKYEHMQEAQEAKKEAEAQGIDEDYEAMMADTGPGIADMPMAPTPPDRAPRKPAIEVPPGTGQLDDMSPRQSKQDLRRVRADLKPEPDIDEDKEKPYEKKVSKDDKGNLKVEG